MAYVGRIDKEKSFIMLQQKENFISCVCSLLYCLSKKSHPFYIINSVKTFWTYCLTHKLKSVWCPLCVLARVEYEVSFLVVPAGTHWITSGDTLNQLESPRAGTPSEPHRIRFYIIWVPQKDRIFSLTQ